MRKVSIIALAVVFTLFTLGFAATDSATQDVTMTVDAAASIASAGSPSSFTASISSAGSNFSTETKTGNLDWTVNGSGSLDAMIGAMPSNGSLNVSVDTSNTSATSGSSSVSDDIDISTTDQTIIDVGNEAISGVPVDYEWIPTVAGTTTVDESLTVTFTLVGIG